MLRLVIRLVMRAESDDQYDASDLIDRVNRAPRDCLRVPQRGRASRLQLSALLRVSLGIGLEFIDQLANRRSEQPRTDTAMRGDRLCNLWMELNAVRVAALRG